MSEFSESSFLKKFKGLFQKKENASPRFSKEQATEQFTLLSAAGPEGQVSLANYQDGSTVMLNQFPPGTIIREKISDVGYDGVLNEPYLWHCIGDFDPTKKSIDVFSAIGSDETHSSTFRLSPHAIVTEKKFLSNNNNGSIEFTIGDPGIMNDIWIHQNPLFFSERVRDRVLRSPESRKTLEVAVMKWGTPIKTPSFEKSKSIHSLQPATQGSSV